MGNSAHSQSACFIGVIAHEKVGTGNNAERVKTFRAEVVKYLPVLIQILTSTFEVGVMKDSPWSF